MKTVVLLNIFGGKKYFLQDSLIYIKFKITALIWNIFINVLKVSWPKNENSVINYSPSCRSKPVRLSIIFGTQIKIFLMKSESFLTLHRQQGFYHDQGTET